MIKKIIKNLFNFDSLKKYQKIVEEINNNESKFETLSNEEIKSISLNFRKEIRDGKKLDDVLPEAFSLVREVAKRTLNQRHYDVQLICGIALHNGGVSEMLTGEGKTLASTAPIYLNALEGKGVHVVTVNDYLAKRDTVWMGQIYEALGISVSCIVHDNAFLYDPNFRVDNENEKEIDKERDEKGSFKIVEDFLRPISRKEAYEADITYGTNHEFGFDYLRDNLVLRLEDKVQREHNYVIIDEVDSILIDEARTPLIISAPDEESSEFYIKFANIVKNLIEGEDYEVDEKKRTVNLTNSGFEKAEKMAGVNNIYSPENSRLVHYLNESLKAKGLFRKDKEYVIKNNEIIIVDQFTGRLMEGRRYSGGLHQAIEAKEGVPVRRENKTFAQITIQNYFRFYKKISGMTGTGQTSAEEFHKVYNLDVVSIPPNKPVIRKDLSDVIYKTKDAKYKAIAERVKDINKKGQPVLLGTASIEHNEILSEYLSKNGVKHEVLNAKNNEREGAIIAQAGKKDSVTVATNMAGRGVDIVLGGAPMKKESYEEVKDLGGLFVIGTERHEARRIDNQLRGRSGRQGDPGSSQFFLSLDDDLLRIFGSERISKIMQTMNIPDNVPIESSLISKAVNQAQKKVEGINFDSRKHLLDFDDVLNKQRDAVYSKRLKFLTLGEKNEILPIVSEILEEYVNEQIKNINSSYTDNKEKEIEDLENKLKEIPAEVSLEKSKMIGRHITRILDTLWVNHLENLKSLRTSVSIRAYAQHEPIVEYRREAYKLYQILKSEFKNFVFKSIFTIFDVDMEKINDSLEKNKEFIKNKKPNKIKNYEGEKIGRNDKCWCGSGKKYKHCHGK